MPMGCDREQGREHVDLDEVADEACLPAGSKGEAEGRWPLVKEAHPASGRS